MRPLGILYNAFWTLAIGIVALYAFFVTINALAPGEVWALTAVVAVLSLLLVVHFVHLRRVLKQGGPNETRRQLNAMRERRGF
jgi:membrane protein implicated in regulation of membrane protease activity